LTFDSQKKGPIINTLFGQKNFLPDNLDEASLNRLCLGIPMAVSLCVKLILLSVLHQGAVNMDGTLYINAARHFAAGDMAAGLAVYPMPAYSLLIALTHTVIPDWISAAYFISISSMVLATIPLYYLTKTMFSMKAAFWACLIFALLPKMNEWSLYVSRDPLFLLIAAWFVLIALKSSRETGLLLFSATFLLAWTAILIRIEGLIFIFFYAVILIRQAVTAGEPKGRHYLKLLIWLFPLGAGLMSLGITGIHGIRVNRFDQVYRWMTPLFNGEFLNLYFQIYNFLSEAENHPPFSGWHYNFAALARHYLLIIYMMGIIQVLLKIISPLSFIPLYMALKKPVPSQGKWVLWLGTMFIAVVYYSLLTRDFIATRFLMMPAFLLLPWIGAGTNALWIKATATPYNLRSRILLVSIILLPAVLTLSLIRSNDNTIPKAVAWLAKNNTTERIHIATNAKRVPFYAVLETDNNPNWTVVVYKNENHTKIESFAMNQNATILILKKKHKKHKEIPAFNHFKKIAGFATKSEITTVYARTP